MNERPLVSDSETIRGLIERCAREHPDRTYLRFEDEAITYRVLEERVNRLANGLWRLGLRPGNRVAVMFANHPDHALVFLAFAKLGLVWVPINVHLQGMSLEYIIAHAAPRAVMADVGFAEQLLPVLAGRKIDFLIWRGGRASAHPGKVADFADLADDPNAAPPPGAPKAHDTLCISYTSGTTGAPKGVLLTDKMFRACATAVGLVTEPRPGDVFLLWEPLYHNGGNQVLIAGLMHPIVIALIERFSASRFWDQVRRFGATHIHYLGGILPILLKQPPRPDDGDNPVRIAWGGGCTKEAWRPFEARFRVQIREDYGMTEASGFTTVNPEGKYGSIGKPLPYYEVRILETDGTPLPAGKLGEIVVREKEPGVIMRGYFRNPEATAAALRDGWLHTGDLGYYDDEGWLYYAGRRKDSLRRRGENISAWEVERVINDHPDVEECAVIGVPSELGEDEVKVFIKPAGGQRPDPSAIIAWCEGKMPHFHLPRFVAFVDEFAKTPTLRIRKETLSKTTDDSWDREASGHRPVRRG